MMHRICVDARNGIDGVQMQLNSQLPFAYAHLITLLVHVSSIFTVIKCGLRLALASSSLEVVCQVMFAFVLSVCYLGLLSMDAVIADPFGDDVIESFPKHLLQMSSWEIN